ncbi:MAG: hypothetical protein ACRCSQ_03750, partial [Bacteroidales bacterium]
MKNLFLSLMSMLALGLVTPSCTNEKEMNSETPDATAEVAFELNLLGNPNEEGTKAFTTELGKCASQGDLENLADAGNLTLNVTIKNSANVESVKTPKIRWNGTKFIADPILLGAGSYIATAATVTNGSNEVLFSAVASG